MCLILIAWQRCPEYPLVVAANRDEFFDRPTRPMAWWSDAPFILAGRDLKAGGTWLGISRHGKWAAVTNVREQRPVSGQVRSRGALVAEYLECPDSPREYLARVLKDSGQCPGFNLIAGTSSEVWVGSNREEPARPLSAGVYGISNAGLNTPWPKVKRGRAMLQEQLERGVENLDHRLLNLLTEPTPAPDECLPDTGIGLDRERLLSPILIATPVYGTRSSTILLADGDGRLMVTERTFHPPPPPAVSVSPEIRYCLRWPAPKGMHPSDAS